MASIFAPMKIEDMGTGRAERRVTINGRERLRGDELSHADLASIRTANRNAMIENRMITVFPKHVPSRAGFGEGQAASAAVIGEHHVVARGFGKYDVIKGTVLLAGATKEAAAEFVAAELARAGETAPAAPTGPANADLKPSRPPRPGRKPKKAKGAGSRRRRSAAPRPPAAPPEAGAQDGNGPVE